MRLFLEHALIAAIAAIALAAGAAFDLATWLFGMAVCLHADLPARYLAHRVSDNRNILRSLFPLVLRNFVFLFAILVGEVFVSWRVTEAWRVTEVEQTGSYMTQAGQESFLANETRDLQSDSSASSGLSRDAILSDADSSTERSDSGWAPATKRRARKLMMTTLVAYYFPLLLLQSGSTIRSLKPIPASTPSKRQSS